MSWIIIIHMRDFVLKAAPKTHLNIGEPAARFYADISLYKDDTTHNTFVKYGVSYSSVFFYFIAAARIRTAHANKK